MRHGRLQIEGPVKMGKESLKRGRRPHFSKAHADVILVVVSSTLTESRRRGDGRGLGRGEGGWREREQGAKPCSMFN
jgi:hypothetical protein